MPLLAAILLSEKPRPQAMPVRNSGPTQYSLAQRGAVMITSPVRRARARRNPDQLGEWRRQNQERRLLTLSLSVLEALNRTLLLALILMAAPVAGLRPLRAPRL